MKARRKLTLADYNTVVESYHDETDRAAAILGANFAEYFLEELLRLFMREGKATDELFEHEAFGSFWAKTECAFALRIIDETLRRDLGLIRKIRNRFAHEPFGMTFGDDRVRDWCRELSTGSVPDDERSKYLFAIGLSVGTMHNIMLSTKRK